MEDNFYYDHIYNIFIDGFYFKLSKHVRCTNVTFYLLMKTDDSNKHIDMS